jgi:hypothetical protein
MNLQKIYGHHDLLNGTEYLSQACSSCSTSGTPTEVRATTLYTVTAKSTANNSDSASFSLEVKAIPSNLANAAEHIGSSSLTRCIGGCYCV